MLYFKTKVTSEYVSEILDVAKNGRGHYNSWIKFALN